MSLWRELSDLTAPEAVVADLEDDDYIDNKTMKKKERDLWEKEDDSVVEPRRLRQSGQELEEKRYSGEKISRHELFGDSSELAGLENRKRRDFDEEDELEEMDESEEKGVEIDSSGEEEDVYETQGSTVGTQSNDKVEMKDILAPRRREEEAKKAEKNVQNLLRLLLDAEEELVAGSSQTKHLAGKLTNENSDEEIESSEDEGNRTTHNAANAKNSEHSFSFEEDSEADGGAEDEKLAETSVIKRRRRGGYKANIVLLERKIVENDVRFEKFRRSTLQKWDERTRFVQTHRKETKRDFSAFEKDAISQIDKILADKQRLISRTQVKRTDFERIGGNPEDKMDAEMFDDDDFYQMLLKDLIEKKSSTSHEMNPIDMSRQWLDMEKLRQKRSKKKKVDTKASKGRKIRYTVLQKLLNFHAAAPESVLWTHESRNELFSSLFT